MLPLVFLLFAVCGATNNQVSVSRNSSQCQYVLTVPDGNGQCTANDDNKKLGDQLTAVEKISAELRQKMNTQELFVTGLSRKVEQLTKKLGEQDTLATDQSYRIQTLEDTLRQHGLEYRKFLDCAELRLAGRTDNGVYNITLEHALTPISVWCDLTTDNGGWTLIQRRQDGSVYFYRDWDDYKKGFGDAGGEYWLGNDNIYHLTNQKSYQLRVDLWDFDDNHFVAEYDQFYIENELHKYRLHVGSYNGTAGDAMTYHNNRYFSVKYRDVSRNCAFTYKGGFWYNGCAHANLNGNYHDDARYVGTDAIFWYQLKNKHQALKRVEMKVRPMTFHQK